MTLMINNCEWEIKECSNNEVPLCDGIFYGRCYYFDKTIFLNKDCTEMQKRQTLAHELTHSFLYETQINRQEMMNSKEETFFTEEQICEFMGKYGDQIIKLVNDYFKYKAMLK